MATRVIHMQVTGTGGSALATGNGQAFFPVPTAMNGMILASIICTVITKSTSGAPTVQINNQTTTFDMLSTACSIDANEFSSLTAATPAVVSSTHRAVTTGDLLSVNVTVAGTGTLGLIVELSFTGGLGEYDVMAFGAKGDGSTDDTAAIQAAINAVPGSGGGTVYFSCGQYKITSGLSTSTSNIALVGQESGYGDFQSVGAAAVEILVPTSVVGFTFNPSAAATIFQGPLMRNINFRDTAGTATGGILIKRANNFVIENCTCTEFHAGYGMRSDGTGNVNQYPQLNNFNATNCLIGLDCIASNGIRMIGGKIDANSNITSGVRASSIGVQYDTNSDTLKMFGVILQGINVAVKLDRTTSQECGVYGCRFEGCTTGVTVAGDNNIIAGCNFNNSLLSPATGISFASTADGNRATDNIFAACSTNVSDSGTNNVWLNGNEWHLGDAYIARYTGSGQMLLYNNLYVNANLVIGEGLGTPDATAKIFLGGAGGPWIGQGTGAPGASAPKGSVYIRLDGSSSSTRAYINTNGSTGWTNFVTAA